MTNNKNQQNPPLPKKKRVDAQGNDRKRLISRLTNGKLTATSIIAYGATEECYNHAWAQFKSRVEAGGGHVCDIKVIQ